MKDPKSTFFLWVPFAIAALLTVGCGEKKEPANEDSAEDGSDLEESGSGDSDSSDSGTADNGRDAASNRANSTDDQTGDKGPIAAASDFKPSGWPNWMGPDHNGESSESGWSETWPIDGLPRVWERQIGIGFSSVSIVDGRLFTMGHIRGVEHVYALDASSGDDIWSHSYPSALGDNLHDGGPAATPTVDGEFVYTLGKAGQLFCFKAADGEIQWSKEVRDDLEVRLPEWGFASSPYILGDQLIVQGGRVVSYSKSTGEKNWQTDRHSAGYGSVVSFKWKNETLLAVLDSDGLRIIQAADGAPVDFYEWESPFQTNSTTPIVRDGLIYISSGYNVGCGLFRLDDNRRLVRLYGNRDMRNHFNNSIVVDGFLYGFDGNSNLGRVVQLTCMNFETGEVAWQTRGLGCGSLMIADGKLLILSEDGRLVLARATPQKYDELTRSEFLEGRCWTVPVLLDGRVYGRNAAGRLVCVQLPAK
jgi:outer membrane protein assembly factor BamB